ncbi:hypothetical protein K493DRAFT_360438 [Basidiobolus meristosporus CBS 931.73]|uniref:Uncharacterized protein n=1 Tax=Basidiobolus meristosporus CBS 931.73 TaxID=1314790 RepID=A0A1Y1XHR8_9FUNG|nr:hypothetical protein K493DRAFT_360438 [Basidiobolus meristosporus CBS 931.73]|eukprot:ORX85289.1 hypothetical protein K493DRAFT_360438 [Basidiobolus meristosporus CBS 931.73]
MSVAYLFDTEHNPSDADRKYIESCYKRLRSGKKRDQEEQDAHLDHTVEYLIQALGYEINNQRVEMYQDSLEQTRLHSKMKQKLELATSVRKIRSRAERFRSRPSNSDLKKDALTPKTPAPKDQPERGRPSAGAPRIPSLSGLGCHESFGRSSLRRVKAQRGGYNAH